MLIVNADDWGRSASETDAAFSCAASGRVTSVSAMVFMADSERAASLAKQAGLNVGLHLNLNEPFSSPRAPRQLTERHQPILRFLNGSKYSQLLYHPFLRSKLKHVFQAQLEEFERLYEKPPTHVDGHRHLHLCMNMLLDRIIPGGMKVRGSFSFWPGEKGKANRAYRRFVNRRLRKRHVITEYFFCLRQSLELGRLERVVSLAKQADVEVMTHPQNAVEYEYLRSDNYSELFQNVPKGSYAELRGD